MTSALTLRLFSSLALQKAFRLLSSRACHISAVYIERYSFNPPARSAVKADPHHLTTTKKLSLAPLSRCCFDIFLLFFLLFHLNIPLDCFQRSHFNGNLKWRLLCVFQTCAEINFISRTFCVIYQPRVDRHLSVLSESSEMSCEMLNVQISVEKVSTLL